MATKTPNYNLVKPELNDFADIRVLNGNMDIIDAQLKKASDIDLSNYATKSELEKYMPVKGGNFTGDITVKNVAPMYIIEEGSSELYNAKYIKYSNGTMIQMFFYYPSTTGRPAFIDVNFLQPFIEPPIIIGNRDKRSRKADYTREDLYNYTYEVAFADVTTTGFKASVDDGLGASVFVWGRWK